MDWISFGDLTAVCFVRGMLTLREMKKRIVAMRLVLPEDEALYRESSWSNSVTNLEWLTVGGNAKRGYGGAIDSNII